MRQIVIPGVERKQPKMEQFSTAEFIEGVVPVKQFHFISKANILRVAPTLWGPMRRAVEEAPEDQKASLRKKIFSKISQGPTTSNFVMSLHGAFANHLPFSLSPIVIANIISQEIAQFVKDHAGDPQIASWFTSNLTEKQNLVVEVDFSPGDPKNDWMKGVNLFKNEFAKTLPSNIMEVMTPRFSESTLETDVSQLISFMDSASKYYKYTMVTLCGIPEIRLEGTVKDWNSLVTFAQVLKNTFPGLALYFDNLIPILLVLRDAADGVDVNPYFWKSIYKEDHGSGGPYSNGWFNNLYAHKYVQDYKTKQPLISLKNAQTYEYKNAHTQLNQFPANLSVVNFNWDYFGLIIPMAMVGGVLGVDMVDGFVTPQLGVAIYERHE